MPVFIDFIGWVGAVLVLLAYGLVSTDRLHPHSVGYQSLNIAGALGLVINSAWYSAVPSAVVNVAWIGIGLYALLASKRGKR
ncbi:MAG: CBU_0592 family membrane protein [Acidobacteriota bacterium]